MVASLVHSEKADGGELSIQTVGERPDAIRMPASMQDNVMHASFFAKLFVGAAIGGSHGFESQENGLLDCLPHLFFRIE
jgi:hypothetical protein